MPVYRVYRGGSRHACLSGRRAVLLSTEATRSTLCSGTLDIVQIISRDKATALRRTPVDLDPRSQ